MENKLFFSYTKIFQFMLWRMGKSMKDLKKYSSFKFHAQKNQKERLSYLSCVRDGKLKLRQQHVKSADFVKARTHSIENCDTCSFSQAELNI